MHPSALVWMTSTHANTSTFVHAGLSVLNAVTTGTGKKLILLLTLSASNFRQIRDVVQRMGRLMTLSKR